MTVITELEKQIAEVLDGMGFRYEILDFPREVCAICELPNPDFKLNEKPYHLECLPEDLPMP
jgi:hypothetical protein